VISGLLAVGSVLWWVWQLDLPVKQPTADIGAGIVVPTYGSGPRSHGWWAMVTLLVVSGMIFAMLVFSYLYLWSQRPHLFPQAGDTSILWLGLSMCAASLVAIIAANRTYRVSPLTACLLATISALLAGGALALDAAAVLATGLSPQANAHGGLVFAFLSWQGVFIAICAMMALYALARLAAGLLSTERPMTMQSVALFIGYTAAQGAVCLLITRGFALLA
jgi:cytochrome c oxidase subunit I+III